MKTFINASIFLAKKLTKKLESIVFPPCCAICGKLNSKKCCKDCEKRINSQLNLNIENKAGYYFEKHMYLFKYKNEIRNLILDYKFRDKSYLYELFAKIITKNEKICGILEKYDIIIPVPIHKKRKKQRGYNQSELVARQISKNIANLQLENKAFIKIKNNKPQSTLNKKQRKQNVKNVYKLENKGKIENKNIILFDDIYTTGNTANEIAKILKQNGANKILVLTIAKD
mgnify:FL=1